MATHKISVTVEKERITVTPDPLVMTSADELHWGGTNSNKFTIVFEGASPFMERQLSHDLATTKRKPSAKGRFKYSVVSADDPKLVLDPVVIVDEPPTGPNP